MVVRVHVRDPSSDVTVVEVTDNVTVGHLKWLLGLQEWDHLFRSTQDTVELPNNLFVASPAEDAEFWSLSNGVPRFVKKVPLWGVPPRPCYKESLTTLNTFLTDWRLHMHCHNKVVPLVNITNFHHQVQLVQEVGNRWRVVINNKDKFVYELICAWQASSDSTLYIDPFWCGAVLDIPMLEVQALKLHPEWIVNDEIWPWMMQPVAVRDRLYHIRMELFAKKKGTSADKMIATFCEIHIHNIISERLVASNKHTQRNRTFGS